MIGWDKAGSGMVTAFVKGDVAAVKAAIDAGAEAAGRVGSGAGGHPPSRPPAARRTAGDVPEGEEASGAGRGARGREEVAHFRFWIFDFGLRHCADRSN